MLNDHHTGLSQPKVLCDSRHTILCVAGSLPTVSGYFSTHHTVVFSTASGFYISESQFTDRCYFYLCDTPIQGGRCHPRSLPLEICGAQATVAADEVAVVVTMSANFNRAPSSLHPLPHSCRERFRDQSDRYGRSPLDKMREATVL